MFGASVWGSWGRGGGLINPLFYATGQVNSRQELATSPRAGSFSSVLGVVSPCTAGQVSGTRGQELTP